MKNFLYLSLLLLISSQHFKTFAQKVDEEKIRLSYDHIKKKYQGIIIVSDTIVNLSSIEFSHEISKKMKKKHSIVYDSLKRKSKDYKEFQYPIRKLLGNYEKDGGYRFYFSKPSNNQMIIEVFDIRKWKETAYNVDVFFGESDLFLLCFENNKITEEFKITLSYN
jgi:hypothetical protein